MTEPTGDPQWERWRSTVDDRLDAILEAIQGPVRGGRSSGMKADIVNHEERLTAIEHGRSGLRTGLWGAVLVMLGSLGSYLMQHLPSLPKH